MRMYPLHDLYRRYKDNVEVAHFSSALPDVTKAVTLENMNFAINLCEDWGHAMDIGGGTGHYLAPLAEKFTHATLVEVETLPEHVSLTKSHPNITIHHGYIEKYHSDKKVDFILLADLYEHIPDIKTFVSQISTLQDDGGVVYIMTPNPVFCGPAPKSNIYHTIHPNGHIKHYPTSEITTLMEQSGYRLELEMYEEAPLRQQLKRIVYAVSRRDKKWHNNFLYQLIRPIVLIVCLFVFKCIEIITIRNERKHRFNPLLTKTQDLIFKKMPGH